ncbi:Heterokaryon incompatibility 6-like protein [Cladobotryum mycophilum]|uniref:Heterokaryon incompatibility 6-like protein n=1 Tax=Cladobotryum mycophilum TaxID=491253 RepID=A0ABR0SHG0_9HYPO
MSCCALPQLPHLPRPHLSRPHFRRFWPKSWTCGCGTPSISDAGTVALPELYSDLKRDEIRLLTFKSLHKSDPVELQMQTVTVGTHSYQALSYVWGDPDVVQAIQVNDCTINVTTNLYAALEAMRRHFRRLKSRSNETCFWIDAVCVDQENSREKNQQVQLMGEIYSKAFNVLAWLGPADDDSNTAMRFFERWGYLLSHNEELQTTLQGGNFQQDVSDHLSKSILRDADRRGREKFLGLNRLNAVGRFSNRSYWGRLWTLQEQVLARRGTIMCGKHTISASTMLSVGVVLYHIGTKYHFPEAHVVAIIASLFPSLRLRLSCIRGSVTAYDLELAALDYCFGRLGLTLEYHKNDNPFLHLILEHSRDAKSADPRDKIYGLLGLVSNEERPIEPDYDLDVSEVYTRYWTAELKKADGFKILGMVATRVDEELLANLPSWVPDFRGKLQEYVEHPIQSKHAESGFVPTLSWSRDGRELTLQGYLFDQIEGVYDFYVHTEASEQIWKCVEFIFTSYLADPSSLQQADCPWTVALFHAYMIGKRNDDIDPQIILKDEGLRDEVLLYFGVLTEWAINADIDQDTALSFLMPPGAEYSKDLLQSLSVEDQPEVLCKELLRQVAMALGMDPELVDTFPPTRALHEADCELFTKSASNWQNRHRLVLSKHGYIGSTDVDVAADDEICLVPGCPRALILRPKDDDEADNRFELVGRANFPFMTLEMEEITDFDDICLV